MCRGQSIKSWFDILKWKASPLFGACNQLEYSEFIQQYYSCEKISSLEDDIFQALIDGNRSNIMLHGSPGSGKTTFLYYLLYKSRFSSSGISSKYVFYIFHANKADDEDNYRELTRTEIYNAWEIYYAECDQSDSFNRIAEQEKTTKEKLNSFVHYYKLNKKLFLKTLIFIIDDVDLLDDEMAKNISKSVVKDIELTSVVKWISIRPCTLINYSKETKDFLDQFFPAVHAIPDASLFDIIEHRIQAVSTSEDCKNPFSLSLCDSLLYKLFEGNKRRSLSILKSILENSLPGGITTTSDEKFIQRYIDNTAINTFLKHHLLPNLHEASYRSDNNYPLPSDIVQLLKHTKDKHIIQGCLNEIAAFRSLKDEDLVRKDRTLRIRDSDLNFSLDTLINAGIVRQLGASHFTLTESGSVLAEYSARDHYNKYCQKLTSELDSSDRYWKNFYVPVDYSQIVDIYLSWKRKYK